MAPFLLAVLSIRPARGGCSASSENGKCRVCGGGLCATSPNFKGRLKQSNLNDGYIIKHCQINLQYDHTDFSGARLGTSLAQML